MKITDPLLNDFLEDIKQKYGDDFTNYHYTTLRRRIELHSIKLNINHFELYTKSILSNQDMFEKMFEYFSINITEFFREPEQLKILQQQVISYLQTFPYLKIWCAGCSSGEEAYTLSILLEEAGLLEKCQIYATDFNNKVIARAKEGLYEISDFDDLTKRYKKSGGCFDIKNYFVKQGKYYQIKKHFKQKILFYNHNLVTDGLINNFQLIVCKNVLIYFNRDLKETILKQFEESLVYNGFLNLGNSEFLPNSLNDKFKLYIKNSKVYQKRC